MRKLNKSLLLGFALILVMMFANATCVFAATSMDDATKQSLAAEVETFIGDTLKLSDQELDATVERVKQVQPSQSGFYQTLADAVEKNRKDLGAFKSIGTVQIDDTGKQVAATTNAKFEKLTADVTMYFEQNETTGQYIPKNIVIDPVYPLGTKIAQAGQNTLTGVLTVFVMLFFLSFVISLFKYIGKGVNGKQTKEAAPAAAKETKAAPVQKTETAPIAEALEADEAEIAAVIAAAIATAEEEAPSTGGYFVRSIRKKGSGRRWTRA
jgi:Na+-transporting methylmalonyl-CoA/oxaloacetate decarboxylase gamma subunit